MFWDRIRYSLNMKTILLAILLWTGCAAPAPMPRQAEALAIVWTDTYSMQVDPPEISWWTTNCPNNPTTLTAVYFNDMCYAGLTFSYYHTDVAWRGSFSSSAFAHELMHVAQAHRGLSDPNHAVVGDWSLVDVANTFLKGAGL